MKNMKTIIITLMLAFISLSSFSQLLNYSDIDAYGRRFVFSEFTSYKASDGIVYRINDTIKSADGYNVIIKRILVTHENEGYSVSFKYKGKSEPVTFEKGVPQLRANQRAGDNLIKSANLNYTSCGLGIAGGTLAAIGAITFNPELVVFGGVVIVGGFIARIVANEKLKKAGKLLNEFEDSMKDPLGCELGEI